MGIDWKMSRSGSITASALLLLAAHIPTASAKSMLSPKARIILIQEETMSKATRPN